MKGENTTQPLLHTLVGPGTFQDACGEGDITPEVLETVVSTLITLGASEQNISALARGSDGADVPSDLPDQRLGDKAQLVNIEVTNFGVLGGHNVIDIGDARTVAILGHNGTGKTTLAKAIRWLLTGRIAQIEPEDERFLALLNHEAARSGQGEITVKGTFKLKDEDLVLERSVLVNVETGEVQQSISFKSKDTALEGVEAERYVVQHFGTVLSKCSFFDAEELAFYVGGATLERIHATVSEVIGLDELTTASNLLDQLSVQRTEIIEHLENDDVLSRLNEKALTIEENMERIRSRIHEIETELGSAKEEDEKEDLSHQLEQLDKLGKSIEKDAAAVNREATALRAAVPEISRDLVRTMGVTALEAAVIRRQKAVATQEARGKLKARIEILQQILNDKRCICGDPLGTSGFGTKQVKQLLAQLDDALSEMEEVEGISSYESIASLRSVGKVLRPDKDVPDLGVDINSLSDVMDSIQMRKRGLKLSYAEHSALARRLKADDETSGHLKRLKREAKLTGRLEELKLRLDEQRRRNTTVTDQLDSRRKELQDEAIEYDTQAKRAKDLAGALDKFRDLAMERIMATVISEATGIYRSLTNKPNKFKGLGLSNSGEIIIKSSKGDQIQLSDLSYGERQISVMALLSGIGRTVSSPLLMIDTPFARLDELHRKSILENISDLAPQVILMSTGAEVGTSLMEPDLTGLSPMDRTYILRFDPKADGSLVQEVSKGG